ncbi:MAG: glycine cleavage system aminomethyltransferase GcvT [Mariprofundaceae bacterium]
MNDLHKTPLYDAHVALGGKMVPFAGSSMPVQYPAGVLAEYQAVRESGAGIFDICHMGQVRVSGEQALDLLQYLTSNDVAALADGQVQYSALLNDAGAFIDDITTYRISADAFYLCINAANRQKDVAHLLALSAEFNVDVVDESDDTALLAIQGQTAQSILQALVDIDLESIAYYRFACCRIGGYDAIISRTGYTGEDGFEIYLANGAAGGLWQSMQQAGATPCGLAVRDMLRTEMGYALYGHEISADVTPVEARLMWITKLDKGEFLGRAAVAQRRQAGPEKVLIGLKLAGRGVPREGYAVLAGSSKIGVVTSGAHSPLAGAGVALAYVSPECADRNDLAVEIRGKPIAAKRMKLPFIRSNVRR